MTVFQLTAHKSITEGSQGRNIEAGSEAEARGECCFLAYFHGSCSLLHRTICPRAALSTVGWALPHQSSIEKQPQIGSQVSLGEAVPQLTELTN